MTHTLVTAPHGTGALRYSDKGIATLIRTGAKPECFACEAPLGECAECGATTCEAGAMCDLPTPVEVEVYRATYFQPAEWQEGCSSCKPQYGDDDRW